MHAPCMLFDYITPTFLPQSGLFSKQLLWNFFRGKQEGSKSMQDKKKQNKCGPVYTCKEIF